MTFGYNISVIQPEKCENEKCLCQAPELVIDFDVVYYMAVFHEISKCVFNFILWKLGAILLKNLKTVLFMKRFQ